MHALAFRIFYRRNYNGDLPADLLLLFEEFERQRHLSGCVRAVIDADRYPAKIIALPLLRYARFLSRSYGPGYEPDLILAGPRKTSLRKYRCEAPRRTYFASGRDRAALASVPADMAILLNAHLYRDNVLRSCFTTLLGTVIPHPDTLFIIHGSFTYAPAKRIPIRQISDNNQFVRRLICRPPKQVLDFLISEDFIERFGNIPPDDLILEYAAEVYGNDQARPFLRWARQRLARNQALVAARKERKKSRAKAPPSTPRIIKKKTMFRQIADERPTTWIMPAQIPTLAAHKARRAKILRLHHRCRPSPPQPLALLMEQRLFAAHSPTTRPLNLSLFQNLPLKLIA